MALSTYLANKLLDHAIGKTAFAMPTAHLALFTAAPNAGGGGTETSYTSYARKQIAGADMAAASAGASTNANELAFPAKSGGADATVTHWATFDASSGGNMLEFGALTASKTITNGDTPKFAAGEFDRTAS
jgi:hypothetical protein